MTDEMRERLARLDPMPPGVPTEAVTTPSSRRLMEEITSMETATQTSRGRWMPVAAALALVVGLAATSVFAGGGEPLALAASDPGATGICMQFSVDELARAEVAFEGKAVSVEGSRVELEVENWFKGGDTGRVVLEAPTGMELLIDGISFESGDSYLVSASAGSVNYCGFSGVASDQLRAAFQEAFGG